MDEKKISAPVNLLNRLHAFAENDVTISHVNFFIAGLVGVIFHPLFYFTYQTWYPLLFDLISLRVIGVASCLLIMLHKFWPNSLKPMLPFYWYFVLFYNLPYFSVVMLIENEFTAAWYLSCMLSIFFLTILVLEWTIIIFLLSSGILFGLLTAYAISGEVTIPMNAWQHLPVFILAIVGGIVFNQRYKRGMIAQEKLKVVSSVSNIAHELRSPLLGIKSSALGLKYYLPILMKGYTLARENNLSVPEIPDVHYKKLISVLNRIESEGDYSHAIIDMLLASVNPNFIDLEKFAQYPMVECIDMALERYPFKNAEEKKIIHWRRENDFKFFGSDIYMIHIVINLLRNALHAIQMKKNGSIHIWLENAIDKNYLYVKDTGMGIPKDVLPHIFQRFYSTTQGMGIGLTFCQEVMTKFGGRILCDSVEGEFTTFILIFPRV